MLLFQDCTGETTDLDETLLPLGLEDHHVAFPIPNVL